MIRRLISVPLCFCKSFPVAIIGIKTIYAKETILEYNLTGPLHLEASSNLCDRLHLHPCLPHFSTAIQPTTIGSEGCSSRAILLSKFENSLKHRQLAEAWEVFSDFRRLHGFPNNSLISRLISQVSYSCDPYWLQKAYELVLLIMKDKSDLLHYDFLARLALSLARAQMPIPTSTVLRLMLQLHKFPPMDIWRTVFLHMVKTDIGTYLASDLLIEICDCFLSHTKNHGSTNFKHLKLIKPDTMIFNLVLDACVRFQSTLKAEQIIELMSLTGAVSDASTIVVISRIYEMNGRRVELKKLKDHIDQVSVRLLHHYCQFYDSLLSLHFKFNDIDSAAELVLDMYRHHGSLLCSDGPFPKVRKDPQKPCLVTIGSHNLRTGLRLQIEPELLQKDFVLSTESQTVLVKFIGGKLVPSNKTLAKLINGYKRLGKLVQLSKLLVSIQKVLDGSREVGLISDVIYACIQLGWLQTAHDILDDMELAGISMGFIAYMSLLRAYCKGNMFEDAKVLLKQMRKAGLLTNLYDEEVVSKCLSEKGSVATLVGESSLAEALIKEMREEEKEMPQLLYEIDSSIYFFCKGNMMEDALKTYKRMQERKLQPTMQTFADLVNGYSSLRMYREITILWGEIRRRMDSGDLIANRDLHELLLCNFIRGGYFERVMQVLEYMKNHGMYTDKWKYKREFLKFHKDLYRSLKSSKANTEVQNKRLEHVRAFRKWLG